MDDDKDKEEQVNLVKQYRLKKEHVESFERRLNEIKEKPMVEDINSVGEAKVTLEEFIKKSQELNMLLLEMNICMMKNILATYTEATLEKEIANVQMAERLQSTLKNFGIDSNTFKRMFGSEE